MAGVMGKARVSQHGNLPASFFSFLQSPTWHFSECFRAFQDDQYFPNLRGFFKCGETDICHNDKERKL